MSRFDFDQKPDQPKQAPISLWKFIGLVVIFVFGIVVLFGIFLYLFISGAQQLGLSTPAYLAIIVILSGIFAWLVKRLSESVSGLSRLWFPGESDDHD